jgi:hypothetical protein
MAPLFVRSLIVFLIVMGGLALFQADRNDCYWHGIAGWADWLYCVCVIR